MNKHTYITRFMTILAAMCISLAGGCAHKPPTIAHTHIGHAITGFEGTPGDKGLFVVAEERAKEAQRLARDMVQTNVTESQANNNARELIAITTTDTYSL